MKISDEGIAHLKRFEGCRYEAYLDLGGVPTIGYGSTGPDVQMGMQIDEAEAERRLRKDLETAEKCVQNCVKVNLTQGAYDALVSFTYNVGCGSLRRSTLLQYLNDGQDDLAAKEFLRWNRVRGNVQAGLTKRREAERDLFLS